MATLALIALSLAALLPAGTAQCSQFCTCIDSLLADCSGREAVGFITEIPVVPATTTELILTGNNISTLASGSFSHLPALTTLRLDRNQLTTIPPDGLDSLPQLQSLNLDSNPLQELGSGVFRNLSSLTELSIQDTPLTTLTGGAFQGLDSLTTLRLDNNQLSNLSTNFLEHLPSLTELSLTGNDLYGLPDGFFTGAPLGTVQVDLHDNPWSCDCRLGWIADFLDTNPALLLSDAETVCLWSPSNLDMPISGLAMADFICGPPSLTQQPQNDSILTDRPYTLTVSIDGAPFPTVTWNKDGETLNYTERIFVSGYDASLQFATVTNSDAGVYTVTLVNDDGGVVSSAATLTVTEATCVDGELTSSHETDVDCGGEFCSPCLLGNSCGEDRDCAEGLVCLYAHQLPSGLHYITMADAAAFTCANSSVPQTLLQSLLTSAVPDNALVVNGNSTREEIESVLHTFMAETLEVPLSALSAVSVSSIDRIITPLYLLQAQVIDSCEEAISNLHTHINNGMLKMTARTTRGQGNTCYNIRLNL